MGRRRGGTPGGGPTESARPSVAAGH